MNISATSAASYAHSALNQVRDARPAIAETKSEESRTVAKPDSSNKTQNADSTQQGNTRPVDEQRAIIAELSKRDRAVRAHEQAHASVGGIHAGAASLSYQRGPNGKYYAVAGEVRIDLSVVADNPGATLEKALIVQRAALAPADPSGADRRIAAQAAAIAAQARAELSSESTGQAETSPAEPVASKSAKDSSVEGSAAKDSAVENAENARSLEQDLKATGAMLDGFPAGELFDSRV